MARQARFEIVHSDAGWFARFRASNGRKMWQTEVYTKRGPAERAVDILADSFRCFLDGFEGDQWIRYNGYALIEVREVDERSTDYVGDLNDAHALGAWAWRQPEVRKAENKIHAIRAVRVATGASLFQAKNAIEAGI